MLYPVCTNKLLELIAGKAKEVTGTGLCYLALGNANEDGSNFVEISKATYPSYKRKLLNACDGMPYADVFGEISSGEIVNTEEFSSTQCLEESGWPEASHFALYDEKVGGNLMACDVMRDPDGELDENGEYPVKPMTVAYKHVAVFRRGTVKLTVK